MTANANDISETAMQRVIESESYQQATQKMNALNIPEGVPVRITIETMSDKRDTLSAEKKNQSKWAKMVQEIEDLDIPSDVWEHVMACSKEFRADKGV